MSIRILFFVVFCLLYLVGLGNMGLVDYDEAVYAEVARSMFERGSMLEPLLDGEPFYEKPPFLYWSEALGYHIFGVSALGARVPNAIAALLVLLALYFSARDPLSKPVAAFATLILAVSVQIFAQARVALTDIWLTLFFVLCLGALHRAFERDRAGDRRAGTGWLTLAGLFGGLAMLTKGAIGGLLPGAAGFLFLLWEKRLSRAFQWWLLPALLVMALVGFSWYLALGFTHAGGFSFMGELFWEHHYERFTEPMQGHEGPFFFYVPVLLLGFLPFSPFLIPALMTVRYRGVSSSESERFQRLFLCFAAITFVLFSIAATKLPNYITPVMPSCALLVSACFVKGDDAQLIAKRSFKIAFFVLAFLLGVTAVFFASLPLVLERLPELLGENARKAPGLEEPLNTGAGPWLCALLLVATLLSAIFAWRRRDLRRLGLVLATGLIGFLACLAHVILPRYDMHFQKPLRDLAVSAAERMPEGEPIVLVGLRHRPSVNFYSGRSTESCGRKKVDRLKALLSEGTGRVGLTTGYVFDRLKEQLELEELESRLGYVMFRMKP